MIIQIVKCDFCQKTIEKERGRYCMELNSYTSCSHPLFDVLPKHLNTGNGYQKVVFKASDICRECNLTILKSMSVAIGSITKKEGE